MFFAKDFPDQLRSQIPTSLVVGKKVALKKKGKEYSGLCPFHNEKSPSFTVNDDKGFYHCFGCAAHGDIIAFTMQSDGLNFKDAVIKLAEDHNIRIPLIANQEQEQERQEKLGRNYLLLEKASQFFENNLFSSSGNQALEYLHNRTLNNQHIKKFRLGFALDSYEALINHLKSAGFNDEELLASGIIGKSDRGKLYDKFRARIIFPITDNSGKIIAFGGRVLGVVQPKYLNSSETELFKKGHNLYNYSFAKKTIHERKFVVVVEGYMDAISLSIGGIENVVAPLGTALTTDQLQKLFKITSDIVICLDGDSAGINAMRRVVDLALPIINSEHLIRFAILPNSQDPDDFIKSNGKAAMDNVLRGAANLSQILFDFEATELGLNNPSTKNILPEKKAQLETKLLQKINLISDPNSKKYFLQYYKNRLFEMGRKLPSQISYPNNFIPRVQFNIAVETDKQISYGIAIIGLLAHFPQLIDYQDELCGLRELEFNNDNLSTIKEHLVDLIDHKKNITVEEIKLDLEKIISDKNLKNKIFSQNFSKQFLNQSFEEIKIRLKIILLKYFHEEVSRQYAELLVRTDEIDTDEIKIKSGKQKELFDYKTFLEKKILQLTNDMM